MSACFHVDPRPKSLKASPRCYKTRKIVLSQFSKSFGRCAPRLNSASITSERMKMKNVACRSSSHGVSRRTLLSNMLAGATGIGLAGQFVHPAVAAAVEAKKKQVLIVLLQRRTQPVRIVRP
jgi:hypothetical protein